MIKVNYNLAYDEENTRSKTLNDPATSNNPKVTISSDRKSATFTVAMAEDVTYPCTFYAVSPASSWPHWNDTESGCFFLQMPTEQTANAASCDPKGQILIGQSALYDTELNNMKLSFSHFAAYGLMSLTGLPEDILLYSVTITAEQGIAGTLYYNVADKTYEGSNLKKTITITTAVKDKVWFAALPADLSNTKLTVLAKTSKGEYTKTITFPADRKLVSGRIARFSVDLTDVEPVKSEGVQLRDIWFENGKPVGIVYWISEDKETIKVLHLQRTSTKIKWSDNTSIEGLSPGSNANPDGAVNTAKLQTTYANSMASVPMLEYLQTLNTNSDGWYWPSRNEFREINIAYEGMSGSLYSTFDDNANTPDKLSAERRAAQIAFDKILIANKGIALNTLADGEAGGDASDDNLSSGGDPYWVSNEASNGQKANYTRAGKAGEATQTKTSVSCYGRAIKTITNASSRKLEEQLRAGTWTTQTLREGGGEDLLGFGDVLRSYAEDLCNGNHSLGNQPVGYLSRRR